MLSLIEIKCPHCGVRGQIALPPVGTIIVGPCPECKGLVVIFCGKALPLEFEAMLDGTLEEKQEYLLETLTCFLRTQIGAMVTEESLEEVKKAADKLLCDENESPTEGSFSAHTFHFGTGHSHISKEDVENFRDNELKLLDNPEAFKSIFD